MNTSISTHENLIREKVVVAGALLEIAVNSQLTSKQLNGQLTSAKAILNELRALTPPPSDIEDLIATMKNVEEWLNRLIAAEKEKSQGKEQSGRSR